MIRNISRGCCFWRDEEGKPQAEHRKGCQKLEVYDWLEDTPNPLENRTIIEVQFKNTRKSFYEIVDGVQYIKGDIIVVEAIPGIDVGVVSITGDLVEKQMRRARFNPQGFEFRKVLRRANTYDIERWQEAISLEHNTMIRAREIASDLGLKMKIGDVEYQGDRMKAIFYYIADDRVDFRELIKIFAEQFRIRVEMRQIGARQEAGRIGGISACGRELCCSTWQNSFSSVAIGAARQQEISLNPQKLAGQCGKLKCCLNYEVDSYIDARKDFPRINAPLQAMDGDYHLVKSDIFKKTMWFSPDPYSTAVMIPISIERVYKILALNRKGVKVDKLVDETMQKVVAPTEPSFINVVGEESITRFDKNNKPRRNNSPNRNNGNGDNRPPREAAKQPNEQQDKPRNHENTKPKHNNRPRTQRKPQQS